MPTPHLPLDSTRIRALFPAFSTASLHNKAFFENAAGSFMSQPVIDLLDTYYAETKVQPYGSYPASTIAGQAMDRAYEQLASAMGLDPDWIQIGPSTSINSYVLSRAFAQHLSPNDTIIVTNQDHEANSGVWRRLSEIGLKIREWQVDPITGQLFPNDLDNLLDSSVKLVAFPHCSNIVGDINPAKSICAKISAAGAISVVDGVSYAPHGLPDVADMGADIYMFSAYKTYGPHQGVMAIRPQLAMALPNQGHYFNENNPRYRLTPAGPDHAQIAALSGVTTYLEQVAKIADKTITETNPFRRAQAAMNAQEQALMGPLLDFLRSRNDIRLIGSDQKEHRAPTFSIVGEQSGPALAAKLANKNIMTAGGHFYAHRLVKALGIDPAHGVLRLSFVHYTTPAEINQLIEALSQILVD